MLHLLHKIRTVWERQHEKLIDAGLLVLVLNGERLIPRLPVFSAGAQLAFLAILALVAAPRMVATDGIWRRYLKLLPGYAGVIVGGGLVIGWWFALPRSFWWFAPLWLVFTLLARLYRLLLQQEKWLAALRRRRLEIPAGDLVLLVFFAFAVPRWSLQPGSAGLAVALLGAAWIALHWLAPLHHPDSPRRRSGFWLAGTVLPVLWAILMAAAGGAGSICLVSAGWLAIALLAYRAAVHRWAATEAGMHEIARWIGLWLLVAYYFSPFVRAWVHGAGDSGYYATFLADALAQFRAGVFPVFVGQSPFQFNGSVVPIRVAPGFQYLGGLVDVLTGRTLGVTAIQNLLIFLTAAGAIFATYGTIRRLPLAAWLAWALAVLFFCCPGVLAIVFVNDLYMSWLTVPWVPLGLALSLHTFSATGARLYATLGWVLGVTWWLHAPIALWLTLVAAILQLARLGWRRPAARVLGRELAAGAGAFLLVAAYPVVSSALYPADPGAGGASGGFAVSPEHVLQMLRESFPGAWLPLSEYGRKLGDFQLGYGLVIVAVIAAWSSRRRELWVLIGIMVGLLLLLLPLPGLNLALWRAVPDAVRAITNMWVMQRLYLVLAGCAVLLAAQVWSGQSFRTPAFLRAIVVAACAWSAMEALKFVHGSRASEKVTEGDDRAALENVVLTRYSYGFFPARPAYFTHGVTDPALENRLLAADLHTVVAGNHEAAVRQSQPVSTHAFQPVERHFEATPRPVLLPGRHYLATISVAGVPPVGALVLEGRILRRVYGLPDYGEARGFGLSPGHNPVFPLYTSGTEPEVLKVIFGPADRDEPGLAPGQMKLQLTEYDPATLPVRIDSWIPYRARVTAMQPLWLETPRAWQAGYVAAVDGQTVGIRRSIEGLVTLPVPAGASTVELRYVAPAGLRLTFWLSFSGLLLGTGWAVVVAGRALRSPAAQQATP